MNRPPLIWKLTKGRFFMEYLVSDILLIVGPTITSTRSQRGALTPCQPGRSS